MRQSPRTEHVSAGVPSAFEQTQDRCRLVDRFAPDAEVRERHEIVIDAPAGVAFAVAEDFDLLSIRPVRWLFWLRARAMGAQPPAAGERLGLGTEMRRMGWGELARRPGRELAVGAAVQPWLPQPVFTPVPAADFVAYAKPAHVKIVWTLEAEPLARERTRFRTETRVVATDEEARRKFRRYWLFARSGIVLIRRLLLPALRREAERRAATGAGPRA